MYMMASPNQADQSINIMASPTQADQSITEQDLEMMSQIHKDTFRWFPRPRFVVDRSPALPQRGYISPEVAATHQMVELVPGSKVYVFQNDIDTALKHGVDLRLSTQQGKVVRDGTKIARYVMGLFWAEKELVGRTITPSPRNRDLIPLDINLLSTILGDETFFAGVRIKLEPVDPEDFDMYGWPSTREDIPHHSDSIYGQTEGGSSACEDLQHHSDARRQSTANSQSGPSTHPRSIEDLHSESADQSMLSTNSLCESNACPSPSDALLSEIHQSQYRYPITKSLLTNKQVMSGHVKFNLTNPEGKPDSNTTDDKQTWKYLEQNILTKDKPAMKWPVRNYPCEYCRKVYHKTTRLKDHIKKIHSNQQQTKVDGFPKDIDKGISENSPHAKSNEKDTNMDKGLETESDMLYEKTSWSLETVIKAEGPEVSEFSTSTWGAQKRKPRRKRRTGPCQNQQKKQVSESKQRTNFQDETMLSAQKKMFGKRNRYVDHSYSNQQKILLNQSGPNGQEQQQEVPLSEILQRVGNKLSDSEMTIPMSRKDREMCNRPIVSSGMLFGDADLTLITGNHGNPVLGYGSPAMITGFPALVTGHHGNPAMIADDHGNSAMFTGNHGNPGITENPGIIAGNHGNPVQLAGDHGNPTIPTGNRGNPAPTCDEADGGNIQFWCKCGKSFTCLSLFVQHKFPCEMIKSEPKPGE